MKDCSAIVLAGGLSSRMGKDKALLPFRGTTLLEWQLQKLRRLGIEDIMLSGRSQEICGVRCVLDVFPRCGPLGGIHACLKEAQCPNCLVISVDVPLVPSRALFDLLETHRRSQAKITILTHNEKWEPLIGIYQSSLWHDIEPILRSGNTAVHRLLQTAGYEALTFAGDSSVFCNCNTPQDYKTLCQKA